MPTLLEFSRLRFYIFSNGILEEPKINIDRDGGGSAQFLLQPVELLYHTGFTQLEIQEIQKIVEKNYELLLGKWEAYYRKKSKFAHKKREHHG